MRYLRRFYDNLHPLLKPGRVLLLYGARQVGKTTLVESFLKDCPWKYRLDSGDNIRLRDIFSSQNFDRILEYVEGYELIVIDEAQNIPDIGTALKIVVDQAPGTRVIATGSSSFDISQKVGEPLTGRKHTLILHPVSQLELSNMFNRNELREKLEDYLVFGSYPRVLLAESRREKIRILRELADSYLLKDLLAYERLRSPRVLLRLLKLIALQVGSEVSLNELAQNLGVDVRTVDRYLDLLEKSFVIIRIGGFSGNLRKEITSKSKYFFLDNGIRNAIVSQFNHLEDRDDVGSLFENFIVSERLKKLAFEEFYGNTYFWRTYDGQEIDWLEEIESSLTGYEIKWSPGKRPRPPLAWKRAYPDAEFRVVNRDTYLDFVAS